MTPNWRRNAEKRCALATPGPWEVEGKARPYRTRQRSAFADYGAGIVTPLRRPRRAWEPENVAEDVVIGGLQDEQGGAVGILQQADAEFIAHARTDLPRALEELSKCEIELKKLKGK